MCLTMLRPRPDPQFFLTYLYPLCKTVNKVFKVFSSIPTPLSDTFNQNLRFHVVKLTLTLLLLCHI